MGGSPEERGERLAFGMCVGLLAVACASPVSLEGGRWRAAGSGASVADLAALESGWRRTEHRGPLLAFAAADGASASWIRRCPGAVAPARAEAHALLISLDDSRVREEHAVTLDGVEAWLLRAEASLRDRAVELKAVTRAADGCTDDFLLVGSGALAHHEAAFDRWWQSFEAGSSG
jgi:hypothetical protein